MTTTKTAPKKTTKKGRPRLQPDMAYPSAFAEELFKRLEAGKVIVEGFGTFEVVRIPQKKLLHNFSGRTRIVRAYSKLKFTQSAELKEALTHRF